MPPPLSIDQTIRDRVQNTYFIRSTHLIAYPLMPPPLQLFTPSSQHLWISTGWFLSSSPPPVPALNLSPALLLLISSPMLSKQLAVAVTMATEIRAPGTPSPHLAAAGSDTDDALGSLRWRGATVPRSHWSTRPVPATAIHSHTMNHNTAYRPQSLNIKNKLHSHFRHKKTSLSLTVCLL